MTGRGTFHQSKKDEEGAPVSQPSRGRPEKRREETSCFNQSAAWTTSRLPEALFPIAQAITISFSPPLRSFLPSLTAHPCLNSLTALSAISGSTSQTLFSGGAPPLLYGLYPDDPGVAFKLVAEDVMSGSPNGAIDTVGLAGDLPPTTLDANPVLVGVDGDIAAAPVLGKLESVLVLETLSGRLLVHTRLLFPPPPEALVPAALVPLVPELFIPYQGDMAANSRTARECFFLSARLGRESGMTVLA